MKIAGLKIQHCRKKIYDEEEEVLQPRALEEEKFNETTLAKKVPHSLKEAAHVHLIRSRSLRHSKRTQILGWLRTCENLGPEFPNPKRGPRFSICCSEGH